MNGVANDQQIIKSITKTFSITNGKRISVINALPRNFYKHGDDDDDRQTWNELGRAGGGSVMDELDKEEHERLR